MSSSSGVHHREQNSNHGEESECIRALSARDQRGRGSRAQAAPGDLHLKQISVIYCGETWFTRGLSRGPADARLDCSSHQSTLQQTRLMGINMPELKKGKGWIQPRAENTARCVRMSRKLWGIFKELCLLWQKILSCFIQRPCIARALWLFRRGKKQTSWIKMLDCETGPGRWQRSAG